MPMLATGAADVVMHRTSSPATQQFAPRFGHGVTFLLLRKALLITAV